MVQQQAAIAEKRKSDPDFKSGDGVHPNMTSYGMLAEIILRGLGENDADLSKVPAEKRALALKKHHMA